MNSDKIFGNYDIEGIYSDVNASFPNMDKRPLVGITGNSDADLCKVLKAYYQSVEAAGGVPVIIPPSDSRQTVLNTLSRIDALVLSGGADINPVLVGEQPVQALQDINPERDAFELLLTRLAFDRQIPILGICRGIQTLVIALGGSVWQDIYSGSDAASMIKHSQSAPRYERTHSVKLEAGSLLSNIYGGRTSMLVNSFHHQAVKSAGPHLKIVGTAPDGVVEAVESSEYKSVAGVQWHPEWLAGDDGRADAVFSWLVGEASLYRRARQFHGSCLTLDTHCDTPMFFDKGVDIACRDPKVLVDLHKMDEGGLDAEIMAAYLPQGALDDDSRRAATRMADGILSQIDAKVAAAAGVAPARSPQDLRRNKAQGVHSIMKGIENGYALGKDISNVERYARQGVVYITLCHNGDNDICTSAMKSARPGDGVSEYGEQVIKEMNRCGIMVDLSHGSERSFYDAIDISALPIVCSHASSRAVCNHPRNLTDDQLRALKRIGGVAQVTFYEGFLRSDGKACVLDVMEHLEHMIDVAGIECVGFGSDFDGDGGVPGIASASEMIGLTIRLMRKRYSDEDIALVWGGNFLRVMQQVQDASKIAR